MRRLPAGLRADARDVLLARRALVRLTPPTTLPLSAFRTGPAESADRLLGHYRAAQRRFGVPWEVLAAVNFVETAFGKVRSQSTAGAQGPMQFLPATWRAYGLGGDVHDPHDAILGAANYLRASGAPGDLRRALFAYNHASFMSTRSSPTPASCAATCAPSTPSTPGRSSCARRAATAGSPIPSRSPIGGERSRV